MRQSTQARPKLRWRRSRAGAGLVAALLGALLVMAPGAAAVAPVANNDLAEIVQDTPKAIEVLLNDAKGQPDDVLTVTMATDPPHGIAQVNLVNTISYFPDAGYVGPDSFDYTVCNDEPGPECDVGTVTVDVDPRIEIADPTVGEGTGVVAMATFPVTLTAPNADEPVTVNYATADGTAFAGSDYTAASGTLTFNPGATTPAAPLQIQLVADALDEPDETFFVNLSGAADAGVLPPHDQAAATITDEDPLVSLSVSDATVLEGNASSSPAAFNVTLGAASAKPISVGYVTTNGSASAPGDFQSTSAQVSFAPGETQKAANVNVVGDTTFEENETFTVTLVLPVNAEIADGSATGTIQNNDVQLGMNCDIVGTPRNDTLTGTAANERICGMGGNDTISGGGGDDEIFGDAGNDRLRGDDGGDALEGGRGNDTLSGGAGGDSLEGGAGNDVLNGGAGDDTIDGEAGNDVAHGDEEADVLDGGPGNDTLFGDAGDDRLEGLAGNDRLSGDVGNDFVDGSSGNDRVAGGPGNDQVLGLSGSDRVTGGSGNDLISGGGGADHVVFGSRVTVDLSKARASGEGRDRVLLVEIVTGSGAADTLIGNSARNVLNGRGGRDRIMGRGGGDVLNGGAGNDKLFGQAGRDLLVGSSGNDTCEVGPGGGRRKSC